MADNTDETQGEYGARPVGKELRAKQRIERIQQQAVLNGWLTVEEIDRDFANVIKRQIVDATSPDATPRDRARSAAVVAKVRAELTAKPAQTNVQVNLEPVRPVDADPQYDEYLRTRALDAEENARTVGTGDGSGPLANGKPPGPDRSGGNGAPEPAG